MLRYGDRTARKGLPFTPLRCFLIFDVPSREVRGEHAHRACAQLLVCLQGAVAVLCDDGRQRQEFLLDDRSVGLARLSEGFNGRGGIIRAHNRLAN